MPRRNVPKRSQTKRESAAREPRTPSTTTPMDAPSGWQAQLYRGGEPDRDYVCPYCRQPVKRSAEHVVAWRTEDDDRHRHWHKECWNKAKREGLERYRWL